MSKNTDYEPKFSLRPITCTKCWGAGQIQIHKGTDVFYENCKKCNGAGYIMEKKELV